MKETNITYYCDGMPCDGFLVYDEESKDVRPAILVAHAWRGQDDFARNKARELAQMGYIGFAADLFGNRKNAQNDEEASSLIAPLFSDRNLLQKRIVAAFDTVAQQPGVDKKRIGAIGFCFGGLTVIELLRSGAPVKSVAAFHAVLGSTGAQTVPMAKNIQGSILILHGYNDPLVTSSDLLNTQKELEMAGIDWQLNIYGGTSHAFTNPIAKDEAGGMMYNEKTKNRAWQAMINFSTETL